MCVRRQIKCSASDGVMVAVRVVVVVKLTK